MGEHEMGVGTDEKPQVCVPQYGEYKAYKRGDEGQAVKKQVHHAHQRVVGCHVIGEVLMIRRYPV